MSRDKIIRDGDIAYQIFENETFKAAVSAVNASIIDEWSKSNSVQERENLFLSKKMLNRVLSELERMISDGRIEASNLKKANQGFFGR